MLPSDPGADYIPAADASDWYLPDEHLRWLTRRTVGEALWPVADGALHELGSLVPTVIEPLARTADRHPPELRSYNGRGQRIDEIEFHPAYKELESTVLGFGAVRAAYAPGWRGLSARAPRSLVTAMLYLLLESDQAITGCPIGMMDAAARCLERNDAALAARFVPRIADDTGNHLTVAMFLTEKAGGSDVGANESVATPVGDGTWRLSGEKWFASCAHSDLILVLARPVGAPPGPRGLGLFLMPRLHEDGTRNSFVIHRLKEKFGTHAMASAEVGLRGAFAWQVGAIDRGLPQMMDMVNATRIGIATATAGAMRRSAFEALTHTAGRSTFGRRLDLHPLMRDTLADLVVDSVAGLTAAIGRRGALRCRGLRRSRGGVSAATADASVQDARHRTRPRLRHRGHGGARWQRLHRRLAGPPAPARCVRARHLGGIRQRDRTRCAARHRARRAPRLRWRYRTPRRGCLERRSRGAAGRRAHRHAAPRRSPTPGVAGTGRPRRQTAPAAAPRPAHGNPGDRRATRGAGQPVRGRYRQRPARMDRVAVPLPSRRGAGSR